MKLKHKQNGFVPLIVIVALIFTTLLGGYAGFKLGDGTFFSIGIGLGITLFLTNVFWSPLKRLVDFFSSNKNDH